MKNRWIVLVASLCGAVVGVLIVRYGVHIASRIPAFAIDRSALMHGRFLTATIPWILFSLYWEVAAKGAAKAKSSESSASRAFHVLLANVAVLLVIGPIRGLGRFLPASSLSMAAGPGVELLGLFLAIWARRVLGRNWSGEISIKLEHQLIRSGPYQWLRHPIYTGLLAMYVGGALITGEWLAIVGVAMAGFAYWRKIRLEEANLRVAFGAEYEAYRGNTWALIPGLF
jgi:isoprenylcysteine carboxyl methyltransferase (ICMT) family protein YpbQ